MSRSTPSAVILGFFSTYPLCQDLLKNEGGREGESEGGWDEGGAAAHIHVR